MWCCQARWKSTLVVGIQTPAEAPWTLPRDLEGFPGCHVQPNCLPLPTSDDAPDDDADLGQAPPRRRRLRRCNMNRGKKLRLSHDALQLALTSKGTEPATCRGDQRKTNPSRAMLSRAKIFAKLCECNPLDWLVGGRSSHSGRHVSDRVKSTEGRHARLRSRRTCGFGA